MAREMLVAEEEQVSAEMGCVPGQAENSADEARRAEHTSEHGSVAPANGDQSEVPECHQGPGNCQGWRH